MHIENFEIRGKNVMLSLFHHTFQLFLLEEPLEACGVFPSKYYRGIQGHPLFFGCSLANDRLRNFYYVYDYKKFPLLIFYITLSLS